MIDHPIDDRLFSGRRPASPETAEWAYINGDPVQAGPAGRGFGRPWPRPLPDATVLFGRSGPVSPAQTPSARAVSCRRSYPPPHVPEWQSVHERPNLQKRVGGGNSTCKKKCGPGSARAARGGVLSRPDERSSVKRRRVCTSRAYPRLVRTEYPADVRRAASTTDPPRSSTRNGRSCAPACRRPRLRVR